MRGRREEYGRLLMSEKGRRQNGRSSWVQKDGREMREVGTRREKGGIVVTVRDCLRKRLGREERLSRMKKKRVEGGGGGRGGGEIVVIAR